MIITLLDYVFEHKLIVGHLLGCLRFEKSNLVALALSS